MRLCTAPGCSEPVGTGNRCREHNRERNRRYASANRPTYNSGRWRLTRHRKVHIDPICELCENALATEVHHRTPLTEDDSDGNRYSITGLVSVCSPCHSRETRHEQLERHCVREG
jgi:5-methylcytosine-specific restriction protein A